MFDLMKPMLVAMLGSAAYKMESRSKELYEHDTQSHLDISGWANSPARISVLTRAGIWRDAAAMIRESIT